MRHYNGSGFGSQLGLFAGMLGLVFSCAQGCANGDTKQGSEETGGDGNSSVGGASTTGGETGQGGTTMSTSAAVGGITSIGGAVTGGAATGGKPATGGETSTEAVGGSETGGVTNAGGTTGSEVGGITGAGGAPPATGGAGTGGVPPVECKNSLDCVNVPDSKTICNPAGQCVQCVMPADCGGADAASNHDCINNKCIEFTPCNTDDECPTGGCSARHRCVECTEDSQCSGDKNKCLAQSCRTGCSSDNDCTKLGMLCDKTQGVCTECDANRTCDKGLLCDPTGKCVPPVCTAGERICQGTGIATCVTNGSGFGAPKACPVGASCKQEGGVLGCYDADGGLACDVPGGEPCAQIPTFIGTQKVDAVNDDFCGIPYAVLDKDHNQGGKTYNAQAPEVASIQVAWSATGLHVFVDVVDASVQTVQMSDPTQAIAKCYQGDSIEILFSSSGAVTGLTGTDNNTLHVQIPASGPAVSVKTTDGATGTPTALPEGEYKQKITSTGYAIEALLPWPGMAKPNMGATIRFDLTLNSADKNNSGVDNMRDASLFYHLGDAPNTTCKGNDGTAPYCDDRTWCQTKLQ